MSWRSLFSIREMGSCDRRAPPPGTTAAGRSGGADVWGGPRGIRGRAQSVGAGEPGGGGAGSWPLLLGLCLCLARVDRSLSLGAVRGPGKQMQPQAACSLDRTKGPNDRDTKIATVTSATGGRGAFRSEAVTAVTGPVGTAEDTVLSRAVKEACGRRARHIIGPRGVTGAVTASQTCAEAGARGELGRLPRLGWQGAREVTHGRGPSVAPRSCGCVRVDPRQGAHVGRVTAATPWRLHATTSACWGSARPLRTALRTAASSYTLHVSL